MSSPLPPGALPWYHPRRVVDDAATVGAIVALALYWLFACATNALGGRDEVHETRAPLLDGDRAADEDEWAEARAALCPVEGRVTLPVHPTGWPEPEPRPNLTSAARVVRKKPKSSPTSASSFSSSSEDEDPDPDPNRHRDVFELHHETYPPAEGSPRPAPVVLLLNPTGGSALGWVLSGAVAHLQSRGFRVLLLDFRGQGRSDTPSPGPYTVKQMALDIAATLHALRLDRVHVVGYSLGAAVALQLAVLDAARRASPSPSPSSSPSPRGARRPRGFKRWVLARVGRGGDSRAESEDERARSPPLLSSLSLFGFTSDMFDGKSPVRRAATRLLASEGFVRALGVRRFGRLLASMMRFNWRAIDDGGGYPVAIETDAAVLRDTDEPAETIKNDDDGSYSSNRRAPRARLLDTRALRLMQTLGNDIDGYAWTVRSWLDFDVADELASVEIPAMHVHAAGEDLAGHTRWKKEKDAAALRRGRVVDVPGPYGHGLPYEATAAFVDAVGDFVDRVERGEG